MNDDALNSGRAQRLRPTRLTEPERTTLLLRIFMVTVAAEVLSSGLRLPWRVLALVFAIAATTLGIICLVRLIRQRQARMLSIAVSFGLFVSALLLLANITVLMLWPLEADYEQCLNLAITEQAKSRCQTDFENALKIFSSVSG